MTIIANPIYDSVFKFLMEDNRVAKVLLSALLQKDVLEVQMRQHEYTDSGRSKISLFRLDFSAKIREKDGSEHLILIELQKTWLATETLRFRQYLGTQYLEERNVPEDDNPQGYAYPMISIYILGHKVGDLKEPVIYVRRHYLDEKSNIITEGVPDPFIESLTHDTIIVQIPYLNGRTRTRLERLLNVFDQDYRLKENGHFLEFDEEKLEGAEEQLVVDRLIRAAVAPKVRRSMQVEDEILSEIERRDTEIMLREAKIEQQNQEIEKNRQALEQNKQELEQNKQELEQNKQELKQNRQELEQNKQELKQNRQELEQNRQELEQSKQLVCSMVSLLQASGLSVGEIAGRLNLDEHEVGKMLGNR